MYVDPSGYEKRGREVCGCMYDKLKQAFIADPIWNAAPDLFTIVQGAELDRKRAEYVEMVRRGELPARHHRQGLAEGGENTIDNIVPTGEKFISRNDVPEIVAEFYDKYYTRTDNPHPKKLEIYEENGVIKFGKNFKHTEVTNLQNGLHGEQRKEGLRTEASKKKKKSRKCSQNK